MKKLMIILGALTTGAATVSIPVALVLKGFSNSLNTSTVSDGSDNDNNDVDQDISDSNQGFLKIDQLNLTSDLGEIESPAKAGIIDLIKAKNPQLKKLNIYIKGITLKKVKYTVEKYTGTAQATFKITSLDALFKEKDLGLITNVRESTIIEKIKEKNFALAGTDFASEIKLQVISLSEIKLGWANQVEDDASEITLTFAVVSLEGLFLNNDLGSTNTIAEQWIAEKLLSINAEVAFMKTNQRYQIKIADKNSQTPENTKVELFYNNKQVQFYGESTCFVTYNTKDISALITSTNLGGVEKLDETTLLKKITDLNPVYANYRNVSNTKITFTLSDAVVSNPSLSNQVNITFKVAKLAGIISTTTIGAVENFPEGAEGRQDLLIKTLKTTMPLLKYLDNNKFYISNIKFGKFETSDAIITNNSFDLYILGYQGTLTINFNIQRQQIGKLLTVKDLGKFYWIKKEDIIQRIKDKNGSAFNDSEVDYSEPSYTKMALTAKHDSLNYYGTVEVSYVTNFNKNSDFDMQGAVSGSLTGEQFNSNQVIATRAQNATDSSFDLNYSVPRSYENAVSEGKTKFVVSVNLRPNKIATATSMTSAELKKYHKDNFKIEANLSSLNYWSDTYQDLMGEVKIPVKFRSRNWLAICNQTSTYNYLTKFQYRANLEKVNGVSVIKLSLVIKANLDDWSSCDDLATSWTVTINSIDLS